MGRDAPLAGGRGVAGLAKLRFTWLSPHIRVTCPTAVSLSRVVMGDMLLLCMLLRSIQKAPNRWLVLLLDHSASVGETSRPDVIASCHKIMDIRVRKAGQPP